MSWYKTLAESFGYRFKEETAYLRAFSSPTEDAALPVAPAPKPLELGCVAKKIITELAPENESKWDIQWKKKNSNVYSTFAYFARRKGKGSYTLIWTNMGNYVLSPSSIEIKGLATVSFTKDEVFSIADAIEKLIEIQKQNEIKKQQALDTQKLEKLFPECAPASCCGIPT